MLRKLCTAILALLLLAGLAVTASAAEIPNWETVDWETFDKSVFHNDQALYDSLLDWLEKDAPYKNFFAYSMHTDGAYSTDFSWHAKKRFLADPENYLIALEKEDEATQKSNISLLSFEMEAFDKNTTVKTIEGINLSYDKNPTAVLLMTDLVLELQRKLNISIIIPDVGIDFASMDWDGVKLDTYFRDSRYYYIYKQWLEYEASLPYLFEWSRHTDGAYATDFDSIAYNRFIAQPEKFLIALAKEDENTQNHVIFGIAFDAEIRDKEATRKAVEGIRLSKEQNPKAVELMLALIEELEEHLQIKITVPKTGDPVMLAVATLVLSGSGLAVLGKRKRK